VLCVIYHIYIYIYIYIYIIVDVSLFIIYRLWLFSMYELHTNSMNYHKKNYHNTLVTADYCRSGHKITSLSVRGTAGHGDVLN
jgi:hypothetical protein